MKQTRRNLGIFSLIIFLILLLSSNILLLYENVKLKKKLKNIAAAQKELTAEIHSLKKKVARYEKYFRYPTELEVREELGSAAATANLKTDIKSMKKAVESLPENWEAGILVVHYYQREPWPEKAIPAVSYFLMVKTLGGTLFCTWGVSNIYTFKSFEEIKSFLDVASDGSTLSFETWRGTRLWKTNKIWNDDFWSSEENILKLIDQETKGT